jgi:hypothetical protein
MLRYSLVARSLTVVTLAGAAAACGPPATAVSPAPLAAPDSEALKSAMVGSWQIASYKTHDGLTKTWDGTTTFAFTADGKFDSAIGTPLGTVERSDTYSLEGRNVKTSHPAFPTLRAESWTANLVLLNYARSETLYLKKL